MTLFMDFPGPSRPLARQPYAALKHLAALTLLGGTKFIQIRTADSTTNWHMHVDHVAVNPLNILKLIMKLVNIALPFVVTVV